MSRRKKERGGETIFLSRGIFGYILAVFLFSTYRGFYERSRPGLKKLFQKGWLSGKDEALRKI